MRARLAALHPGATVDLLGITTQGDRILDQPLADIGGKGLFIKELEVAMRRRPRRSRRAFAEGRADGHAGRIHAGGDRRARGSARCVRLEPLLDLAEPARRRASSARRACGAKRSCASAIRCCRSDRCAATSTPACASSTRASTTAIILAAAGLKRLGFGAAHRVAARPGREPARRRAGRAGASSAAPTAPTSSPRLRRSPIATTTLATTRRARVLARAGRQLPHAARRATPMVRHGELWLRGLLASRDGAEVLRGEIERRGGAMSRPPTRSDARSPTISSRAVPRASRRSPAASVDGRYPLAAPRDRPARRRRHPRHAARASGRPGSRRSSPRSAASPVIFPAIVILPPDESDALARAHADARRYDIAVFVSANAVEYGAPTARALAPRICSLSRRDPAPPRRSPASGIAGARVPTTSFDSEGLLALPELAERRRQARRDLSRRRRSRAPGRHAARARRDRRLRRVLPACRAAIGRRRARSRRFARIAPHRRRHADVERRPRQPLGAADDAISRGVARRADVRPASADRRARARAWPSGRSQPRAGDAGLIAGLLEWSTATPTRQKT